MTVWNRQKSPETCCPKGYEGGYDRCPMCLEPHRWGEERVGYRIHEAVPPGEALGISGATESLWEAYVPNDGIRAYGPTREVALADLQRKVREREASLFGINTRDEHRLQGRPDAECLTPGAIARGLPIAADMRPSLDERTPGHPCDDTPDERPVAEGWTRQRSTVNRCAKCVAQATHHHCFTTWLCDKHVPRQDPAPDETPVAEGWTRVELDGWYQCCHGRCGARAMWWSDDEHAADTEPYGWACDKHVPRQDPAPDERPVAEGWDRTSTPGYRCTEGLYDDPTHSAKWRRGSRGACDKHVPRQGDKGAK